MIDEANANMVIQIDCSLGLLPAILEFHFEKLIHIRFQFVLDKELLLGYLNFEFEFLLVPFLKFGVLCPSLFPQRDFLVAFDLTESATDNKIEVFWHVSS